MAIKLQIRKKIGNVWQHYKVDYQTNVLLSRFTARWVGDVMEVTEESGVDNAQFNISEIAVYDDTASGTEETFVTSLAMAQRLKTLGYTAFYDDADVVIADLISTDASNAIELGTDGKLFASISVGSGTVTSVAVSGSDGIEVDSGSPITTSGTIALGLNRATLVSFLALLESEVKGVAIEDATWTGTENLDLSTFASGEFTLTGNTTITVSNTPSVNNSFVRNIAVTSSVAETLTLPASWNIYGEYVADGTRNILTINFSNLTTAGNVVDCFISQPS